MASIFGSTLLGSLANVGISSAEAEQVAAIGTADISSTEWGYLGSLDQGVATTSTPTWATVALHGTVLGAWAACSWTAGSLGTGGTITSSGAGAYSKFTWVGTKAVTLRFCLTVATGTSAPVAALTATTTALPAQLAIGGGKAVISCVQASAAGVYQSAWAELVEAAGTTTITLRGTWASSTSYVITGEVSFETSSAV